MPFKRDRNKIQIEQVFRKNTVNSILAMTYLKI